MATATRQGFAEQDALLRATASLNAVAVQLESQRRRAIASYWRTLLALTPCLAVAAGPLVMLAWAGLEPAPGVADSPLRRTLHGWLTSIPSEWGTAVVVLLFVWPCAWLAGGFIVFRRYALRPRAEYLHDYKLRVYTAACAAHFPGIAYEPDAGMPWRVVDESGLFPFASDVYRSEDRFSGRWGATEVCFAEALAQRKRERGWGKDRETVYETYFRGIVFIADFNKHFHGTTRLLPRGQESVRAASDQRVELEDPRFEAVFQTWSTDPVDARYVLSPSLMERLTKLHERHPGLRARFHDERLLLLLPSARDRFEPELYRSAGDLRQVAEFTAEVRACLEAVAALDLDTRIWTKR